MADNYLENKMEEYRAGKLAPRRTVVKSSGPKNPFPLSFPPLRVFVTGGASGIGQSIVKLFREVDAHVAFCDINKEKGTYVAQRTGARFYPVDVTDEDCLTSCVLDIFRHWGDIDVVVNNVGIGNFMPIEEMDVALWDKVMNTNVRPAFIIARLLARHRADNKESGGTIINISSTRYLQSEPDTIAYSASKGAITSLTHSLMASLAKYGITSNAIAPGWIDVRPDSEKISEPITEAERTMHPSGRIGTPEDIARLTLFLAHPANNFINGAVIPVDGGMTHKMIYD